MRRLLLASLLACSTITGICERTGSAVSAADIGLGAIPLTPHLVSDDAVIALDLSADGSTVAYLVTGPNEGWYAMSTDGGTPTALDMGGYAPENFAAPELSPDGSHLVTIVDVNDAGRHRLFSIPTDGGPMIALSNIFLVSNGDVTNFEISPSGERVAYSADWEEMGEARLLTVPIGGGAVGQLDVIPGAVDGSAVDSFSFSANGETVLFRSNADGGVNDLYSVPAATGAVVKLVDVTAPQEILSFNAQDDERVIVRADVLVNDRYEILSVPIAGGSIDGVNPLMPPFAQISASFLALPTQAVVYSADAVTDEVRSLYAAALDGSGSAVELTDPDVNLGSVQVQLSPDGEVVYFSSRPNPAVAQYHIFSVPIDGSEPPQQLSVAPVTAMSLMRINASGSHLIFVREVAPGEHAFISIPTTGGVAETLNDRPSAFGEGSFMLSPDGSDLLYTDDVDHHLWRAPVEGGPSVRVDIDRADVTGAGPIGYSASGRIVYGSASSSLGVRFFATLLAGEVPGPGPGPGPGSGGALGSVLTVVEPVRVFDSRPDQMPVTGPKGVVAADTSIDVKVTGGASGVPDDAVAVVLNVTGTEAVNPGFVTVSEAGKPRPLASSLNLTRPGQTRANAVIVPISADGFVSIYSHQGAHIVVDVTGYFRSTDVPVAAGRMLPLTPSRVLETRPDQPGPGPKGLVAANSSIDVQITGVGGVPANASAVVLNITATDTTAPTFITTHGAGEPRPLASTLNINAAGETAPNLAIVPIGDGGKISLYTQTATHLLADVTGYVTGAGAFVDESGLFVAKEPVRLFDTREDQPPADGPKGFVDAQSSITVQVTGEVGIPDQIGLVFANLTATEANTGYITAHPSGGLTPLVSNLNLNGPADTRPNSIAVPITSGKLTLFSQSGAHLLADINGYTLR